MGNGHKNDDGDDRADLTRLEDLSEFLHQDDPELESKLGDFNLSYHKSDGTNTGVTSGLDLSELTDLNELEEDPPALPQNEETETAPLSFEAMEEDLPDLPEESLAQEDPFDLTAETDEEHFSLNEQEIESEAEVQAEVSMEAVDEIEAEAFSDLLQESEIEFQTQEDLPAYPIPGSKEDPSQENTPYSDPERFLEVKNFAQNFSYGQIQGGGNPPFSLVIRHLKYEDEKESILSLLTEFGIVNDQTLSETQKALELGSLLISQISEYSAIILAHKLRRFDCDVEVGLSDEVHPTRPGEQNPKGLVKKNNLRQNISESYKKEEDHSPAKEIIVTTTAQLEGHIIKKYIGVQTSFAIVDEEELERLMYVEKQTRSSLSFYDYEIEDGEKISGQQAFQDYKNAFNSLFVSLAEELKSKAQKEKANALLGLNYQLQQLPFEKTAHGKNCYQLTASATMALVIPK